MSAPIDVRPFPIRDAFKSVGSAVALLGSLVTALVGWGVLTGVQGDAITGLLGAVPGLITLATTLVQAFAVVTKAEPQVTPVDSPAVEALDDQGNTVLVPLVPADQLG